MISVSMVAAHTYKVDVDGETQTSHEVGLQPDYYKQLCGGGVTHEWVIIQAFQFLLERESNTSILPIFDLQQIEDYFPEFEQQMRSRLAEQ